VATVFFLLALHIPYFTAHKTHFFSEICDLNSTCVICAEGKYYFQTYKYPYIIIHHLYHEMVKFASKS